MPRIRERRDYYVERADPSTVVRHRRSGQSGVADQLRKGPRYAMTTGAGGFPLGPKV